MEARGHKQGQDQVILEVEYTPGEMKDNFGYNPPPGELCWQFSVFAPIPVERCRKLSQEEIERITLDQKENPIIERSGYFPVAPNLG